MRVLRKRSIAQMKKNWKSQFLSLGMNKPSKSSMFKRIKVWLGKVRLG
jgi:hypothetical protein